MERFLIATIGKTVGLKGDLKLHLDTDFPRQFTIGEEYETTSGRLVISEINYNKGTIRLRGYESPESARRLTNTKIYVTKEQTLENCKLKKGEYFWFEIIGLPLYEKDECLGIVTNVQRMAGVDYLLIESDTKIIEAGFAKSFLVPYIPRYIIGTDLQNRRINSQDTKEIAEAS